MRYQLSPAFSVSIVDRKLLVGFGSFQCVVADEPLQKGLLALCEAFLEPRTFAEALQHVQEADFDRTGVGNVEFQAGYALLKSRGFLIAQGEYDATNRYSRPALYYRLLGRQPAEVQARLRARRVVVLGCGGVGNIVAAYLATAGVGELVLVDPDDLELSNLTRQIMYRERDIGEKKVDLLEEAIRERNAATVIHKIPKAMASLEDLRALPDFDLLILSADQPLELIYWVNRLCAERRAPFINVGYIYDRALWGPLVIPGETGCFECRTLIRADIQEDDKLIARLHRLNAHFQPPSTGPINSLAAGGALTDSIKFLIGCEKIGSKNNRVLLNTSDMSIEKIDASFNQDCAVCGHLIRQTLP